MKAKYIRESLEFQRGKDPKIVMGVGLMARIEDIVNDPDKLGDLIIKRDEEIESAMDIFLPEEKKKEIARMWLMNEFGIEKTEFKYLYYEEDEDSDETGGKGRVGYELQSYIDDGWELFWREDNYGQIVNILIRKENKN